MSGLELQEELSAQHPASPDCRRGTPMSGWLVGAMNQPERLDFLEKPYDGQALLASVRRAVALGLQTRLTVAKPRRRLQR